MNHYLPDGTLSPAKVHIDLVEADSVAADGKRHSWHAWRTDGRTRTALGGNGGALIDTLEFVRKRQRNRCNFTRAPHEGGKTVIYQVLLANWPLPFRGGD